MGGRRTGFRRGFKAEGRNQARVGTQTQGNDGAETQREENSNAAGIGPAD